MLVDVEPAQPGRQSVSFNCKLVLFSPSSCASVPVCACVGCSKLACPCASCALHLSNLVFQ
ncbi:MAG: hypothetical protein BYD32DRAFT_419835 [Podila humilis]|nr:MAG: hypothetical protein BYD32DRAFT_419835 [Podila humilis]